MCESGLLQAQVAPRWGPRSALEAGLQSAKPLSFSKSKNRAYAQNTDLIRYQYEQQNFYLEEKFAQSARMMAWAQFFLLFHWLTKTTFT